MKKIAAIVFVFLLCRVCDGQIIDFHENMETIDSVFSSGNPGWSANQRIAASGIQSDSSYVTSGDTSLLETMSINLTGKTFVTLSFKHICKISFFDSAFVSSKRFSNTLRILDIHRSMSSSSSSLWKAVAAVACIKSTSSPCRFNHASCVQTQTSRCPQSSENIGYFWKELAGVALWLQASCHG